MIFVRRIDELHIDTQAVAGTLYLAFEYRRYAEEGADFRNAQRWIEPLDRRA